MSEASVFTVQRVVLEVFASLFLRHPQVFSAYVDNLGELVQGRLRVIFVLGIFVPNLNRLCLDKIS